MNTSICLQRSFLGTVQRDMLTNLLTNVLIHYAWSDPYD